MTPKKDETEVCAQRTESAVRLATLASAMANTKNELRIALAAILTLQFNLTLQDAATALGKSPTWVWTQKRKFLNGVPRQSPVSERRGGRRNELMPAADEEAFVEKVCKIYIDIQVNWRTNLTRTRVSYAEMELGLVDHMHRELSRQVGRPVSLATAYNLMARVGRRRFIPYEPSDWTWYCRKDLPNAVYSCDLV